MSQREYNNLWTQVEGLKSFVAAAHDRIALLEHNAAWTPWARFARWWKKINHAIEPDPTLDFNESFDRYTRARGASR